MTIQFLRLVEKEGPSHFIPALSSTRNNRSSGQRTKKIDQSLVKTEKNKECATVNTWSFICKGVVAGRDGTEEERTSICWVTPQMPTTGLNQAKVKTPELNPIFSHR